MPTVFRSNLGRGIALVTINSPPVNAFGAAVSRDIVTVFESCWNDPSVVGIVLNGHNQNFMAGADIAHLMKNQSAPTAKPMKDFLKQCNAFLLRLEGNSKPTVAAVEGFALGGGCELAMACSARIAAPNCVMGLPELLLGLIPGFGGTQRLPRLVGVKKAADMMLTSKPLVGGHNLLKHGLVDAVCKSGDILMDAANLCLSIVNGKRQHRRTLFDDSRLDKAFASSFLPVLEKKISKKIGNTQRHPYACLKALSAAIFQGGIDGLITEAQTFMEIARLPQAKSLCHVFFASRRTAKIPSIKGLRPRTLKSAAVIGGGIMGSGIIVSMLLSGMKVRLKEINDRCLNAAKTRIYGILSRRVKKGRLSKSKYNSCVANLTLQLDYSGFNRVDIVVEAVIEVPRLKKMIFTQLEKETNPNCILASNTSTINFDIICEPLRPETRKRVVGLHFFNPPHVMKLLEIIRHRDTNPQILADSLALAKKLKKTPVVVGNCTGFAVNRMYFPFFQAGYLLADLGISPADIDGALKNMGLPMGVFALCDLIGLDIAMHVNSAFESDFSDRSYVSQFLPLMIKAKRFGSKNNRGIYTSRTTTLDQESALLLKQSRSICSQRFGKLSANGLSFQDIAYACLLPVVNESCRVLEEKIALRSSDLDVASIFGYGFPPYLGGLMFWANSLGASFCRDKLYWLASQFDGKFEHFFKPCSYLEKCASTNSLM